MKKNVPHAANAMLFTAGVSWILHIVVLKPNFSGELNHKPPPHPQAEQDPHSRTNTTTHWNIEIYCETDGGWLGSSRGTERESLLLKTILPSLFISFLKSGGSWPASLLQLLSEKKLGRRENGKKETGGRGKMEKRIRGDRRGKSKTEVRMRTTERRDQLRLV